MNTREPEKACDQCGWIPSVDWTSKRCGSLPFGSCDGTIEYVGTHRAWTCGAKASTDPPQECNWPLCGCDPYADKVIAALQESGVLPDRAVKR